MKRSPNQHGFSFVVLLVVIAGITSLTLTGRYVWHKNKQDKNTGQGQASILRTEEEEGKKKDELSGPSKDGKYLVIKEWGVKIPLSDSIAEAYYEFESYELGDGIALYDAGFDKLTNTNGISCGGKNTYQIYAIGRTKPENVMALSESPGPQYQKFPFSDEYMFGGLGAHQATPPCAILNPEANGGFREDEGILHIVEVKEKAFDSAFKKLQKAE